jgi:molybdate transport system substrate-binding protein
MAFDFTGSVVPVLSAGAVRRGLVACAEAFTAYYGAQIEARFATAPEIAGAMAAGNTAAAAVIAPYAAFRNFAANGWINRGQQHGVGVVRAGIVVRAGAPMPDLSSVEGLRAALERADAVIFNRASSGAGVAGLFARLGLTDALARRTVQVATGAAVVETVAASDHASPIGIGQSTEIRRVIGEGAAAVYAGPLPEPVAIETYYMAGLIPGAQTRAARYFVRFVGGVQARDILAAHGVEPVVNAATAGA